MNNRIERFPLTWPQGRTRTPEHQRVRSPFQRPATQTGSHHKWCEVQDARNLIAQNLRGA